MNYQNDDIMEDINDNLDTKNKRYYLSHSEYLYSEKQRAKLTKIGIEIDFHERMEITQLVCASNQENAREAVINQLEKDEQFMVLKCRIDYLIVGD